VYTALEESASAAYRRTTRAFHFFPQGAAPVRTSSVLAISVLGLVGGLSAFPRASAQTKPPAVPTTGSALDDKAVIRALEKRFVKAFSDRDVNAIMANYAPGNQLFVFDVVPPRQYPSWEAYKKDWEELFVAFPGPVKDSMSELSITVVGSVAFSHHIETGQLTAKDGTVTNIVVRVTNVFRKIKGNWLIVQEHVSVPVDIGSGKADLLSKP
jgi:ketosteroid isomerase-like protein